MGHPAEPSAVELDRECLALARYLTGQTPTGYVLDKYRDAHGRLPHLTRCTPADRMLLSVARGSTIGAWMVDCYTALFFKKAVVRRKSVLLVALLESSTPAAAHFDDPGGRAAGPRLAVWLAFRGALFAAGVAGSFVLLAPVHALLRARSKWTG